jgi:hypothetical protein
MTKQYLETRLRNQKEKTNSSVEQFKKQSDKTIEDLNKFYLYITSLSSGAIVISITFLGNLIDKIKIIKIFIFGTQINLLFIAWLLLFVSIFAGLIRIFSHTNYSHYARASHMLFEKTRLAEVKLEYMEEHQNYTTTIEDLAKDEQGFSIGNEEKLLSKMYKNEKFHFSLSKTCEYINRTSFIIGLLFLISFGILTLSAIV